MNLPSARSSPGWRTRLAWLAVFWVGGVAEMALVAGLLRGLMRLAGLAA